MVATVIAGEVQRDGAAISERALRGVERPDALGIGEGDVVAIMLRNEPAFLEAMLIARQAGCYSCPINWHYKADEAGYILRDCGAKALIVHADLLRQIDGGVPAGLPCIVVEPTARDARRVPAHRRAMRAAGRARPNGNAGSRAAAALRRSAAQGALFAALFVRHHRQAEGRDAPSGGARQMRAHDRDHADRARHQARACAP